MNLRKNLTTPWSNWLRISSAGAILYSTRRAAFLLVTAFSLGGAYQALANVTVTGASGGGNISADTAANATSPAWTTLGAITIAEGANDDFAEGNGVTLVLKVPTGFEFNTAVTPDVTFTPGRNILGASVAFNNSTTLAITLDVLNLVPGPAADTLTMGSSTGIQVRPTTGGPLATGKHIYRPSTGGGSASIVGITNSVDGSSTDGSSNFGDVTEVAGTAALVRVETLANGSGTVVPAQNVTAGSFINVFAIARDAFSNFVANVAAGAWSLPTKTGGVVDGDLVPAGDSKSAVFTGHVTGTSKIRASSGSLTSTDSGTLTVVAGTATRLFLTLPGDTFTAGTSFTITRLTAMDNFTNVATSYAGSKTISYSGPGGASTYTTNVNFTAGLSTTTLTTTLRKAETTNITATATGLTGVPSSSLTVNPSVFVKLQLLVPGETAAPGTTTGKTGTPTAQTAGNVFNVTVNAVDAHWNLINAVTDTVRVTSNDQNAILPADASLAGGNKQFIVTCLTAGSRTLTATDITDGTKSANISPAITVNPGEFVKLQLLTPGETEAPGSATGKTGTPTNQTVGVAFIVTARAVDANWNLVTSANGGSHTIRITSSDANAVLPPDANLTSGDQPFSVTLRKAGNITVTASHVDNPGKTASTSPAIPVNPGPFVKLQLLVPDETAAPGSVTGKTSTPLMQGVGVPFTVMVNAVDANWNVINTNDTLHITSSDTNAVLPSDAALVNGTKTFNVTLNTPGSRTVTASDVTHAGITANTSPAITVSTNPFVKLQLLMPGETNAPGTATGKTGSPSQRTAGTAFNVTVNAVDDDWNVVNNVTDSVRITSSDPIATLPANAALVSGTRVFSVTLKTAGIQTVTATDVAHAGINPDTGSATTVNPAAANKLVIATQPSTNAFVGVAFAQQPVVFVADQFGNVRSNDNSSVVTATRSAGTGTLLGTTNLTAIIGVVAYTNLAHSVATTMTVQFSSGSLIAATSSNITVTSGNTPPTIEVIANQTVYVDHPALIVLTVSDAETAVTNLQLSLVTSNPALVTSENVVFHYFVFDGHWYITVVPTFGLTGTATNTVTVSDGINTASTNFVLTVTPPPPGGARFVNTNAVTIPDVGPVSPYPSTINVTGMSGTITNLTLTLSKIHHEWIKDVHMLLVSPTGQGMVVLSRVSRDPVTNITATLTDASPFVLPDQFDLWSEQFKPTDLATTNGSFSDNNFPSPAPAGPYGPVSFAGSFNGLLANGTWSLYMYDDHAPDQGSIAGGWSLMIATTGGGLPQLQILSLTGAGTTNVVITWSAISNLTYRVQYQSDLKGTNWFDLVPDVTATNNTASAIHNPSAANLRFYRIMLVQ